MSRKTCMRAASKYTQFLSQWQLQHRCSNANKQAFPPCRVEAFQKAPLGRTRSGINKCDSFSAKKCEFTRDMPERAWGPSGLIKVQCPSIKTICSRRQLPSRSSQQRTRGSSQLRVKRPSRALKYCSAYNLLKTVQCVSKRRSHEDLLGFATAWSFSYRYKQREARVSGPCTWSTTTFFFLHRKGSANTAAARWPWQHKLHRVAQ